MPAPDLAFVKDWCRVDSAKADRGLLSLIESATLLASDETGMDYSTEKMPAPVQAWVAAQCAYWINNPEARKERTVMPSRFHAEVLDPYRDYALWLAH